MSNLDVALDDLVAKNRRGGRGGNRGGRGGRRSNGESGPIRNKHRQSNGGAAQRTPYQRAPQQQQAYVQPIAYAPQPISLGFAPSNPVGAQWTHDRYSEPTPAAPQKKIQGDTVHVSNLAADVTDEDVREIFERIGAIKSCVVNFNSAGVSTGTATVTFVKKSDAEKAVADYDEAEVDGRIMKLKLVGTIVTAPVVVKKQKPVVVQQQPQLAYIQQPIYQQPQITYRQPQQQQPKPQKQQQQRAVVTHSRGGAKVARGGRGGGSSTRGGRGGAAKKEVSQDDLDKELDSYHTAAAPPSAAATGQPTVV